MNSITLTLPYPISANRYWAHRAVVPKVGRPMAMTYVTPEAKEYIASVIKIAKSAGITVPYDNRIALTIKLYPHRPMDYKTRMRKLGVWWDSSVQCIDLGNAEKVLADALQGVIYTDDKWIWHQEKDRMEPDEHGARVVVTITPITAPTVKPVLFSETA